MYPLVRPSAPSGIASIASTRAVEATMAAPIPRTARARMQARKFGAMPQRRELAAMTANPPP
jgi:hypothetical protein